MTITAAADGSSLGNPGPAGWAWVVSEDIWAAGGWNEGTNNLGELTAVLELLRATAEAGLADEPLHILADSQYAINVVTKWRHGWKQRGWTKADKQPIKNLDLIQAIDRAIEGRDVTFEWVKGHAGHHLNEMADLRARSCAEAFRDGVPPELGPGFSADNPIVGEDPFDGTVGVSKIGAGEIGATAPLIVGIQELSDTPLDHSMPTSTIESQRLGAFADESTLHEAPHSSAATVDPASTARSDAEVLAAHEAYIAAWLKADEAALAPITTNDTRRVWPDGTITSTLAGRTPHHATIVHPKVRQLGPGVWLIRHLLRWDGGGSVDTAIWEASDDGLTLIHHQSTRA